MCIHSLKSDFRLFLCRYVLFCQKKQWGEILSPNTDVLTQRIKRANYQAHVWRNALSAMQQQLSHESNGWYIETCPDDQGPSTAWTYHMPMQKISVSCTLFLFCVLAFPVQSLVCVWQMKKPARTLIAHRYILIVTLKMVATISYSWAPPQPHK